MKTRLVLAFLLFLISCVMLFDSRVVFYCSCLLIVGFLSYLIVKQETNDRA
jgi:hypothetical protein